MRRGGDAVIARITPTIMDGIVVRWTPDVDSPHEISASRNGVSVTGWVVTAHDKEQFLATVNHAWELYRELAKAAERGPFVRMDMDDVRRWLAARDQRVVNVRLGESLAEALAREGAAHGG